jgi:hypothetical protein
MYTTTLSFNIFFYLFYLVSYVSLSHKVSLEILKYPKKKAKVESLFEIYGGRRYGEMAKHNIHRSDIM